MCDAADARELFRLQQLARRAHDCLRETMVNLEAAIAAKTDDEARSWMRGSASTFTHAAIRLLELS